MFVGLTFSVCLCAYHPCCAQVKQQADQQELLELQCFDADKLSKWELERAGLAAQHTREQAAADKKVTSALLEAQVVQQQELEQLTRRFQVGLTCDEATLR